MTIGISKVWQAGDPAARHPTVGRRHTDCGDLIEGADYALVGAPVAGEVFSPTGAGVQTFELDVTTRVLADKRRRTASGDPAGEREVPAW